MASAAAMTANAILDVAALSKAFDGVQAVRDVSFGVSAGEMVAMIGPNGAGKTTCFNLINGQSRPMAVSCVCAVRASTACRRAGLRIGA
jgi:ABC-type branched-subunit amino acid transport system ATPase component